MAHNKAYKQEGKARAAKKTLTRLLSYMRQDRKWMAVTVLLIFVEVGSNLWGSYMLRPLINDYIVPGNWSGFVRELILLGAIYLTGGVAVWIQYRLLNRIAQNAVARIRQTLFSKMQVLPLRYFDSHQHGDMMSRYTNDIDQISDTLTDSVAEVIFSTLTLVGIFVMMLYISPILTLVTLISIPIMFLCANGIVKRSRSYFKAQQEVLGDMNGYIEEMISGQKVVKLFGQEKKVEADFEQLNRELKNKSTHAQFYSGLMMPVMQNLSSLNFVLISIVGGLLAIFRSFDVGGLAVFLQYSRQFGRPVNQLASLYNSIQAAIAGAERIFEVIDEPSEPSDSENSVSLALQEMRGEVEMKDVVFGYRPEKVILKGISFHAAPGQKIALVGETGAGKTTILNMLPRFFDIQSGEIRIDGYPIRTITRESLRHSMAIVLQDTHLFAGTVRENIRFGRLDASDDDVVFAAKLTAAHSFISRLPQGYDTLLENDGANLSQGQRQLLNIARAAIAEPAILLLDEATSNIDTRSEILIQRGLDCLMKGRTSLIIAHRLSTVRNADLILVLEHGNIIERGNHKELLALKGKYYSMYKEQFSIKS